MTIKDMKYEKCGVGVRDLRRIEGDTTDTTRRFHSERAKRASSLHQQANRGSRREHFSRCLDIFLI